MAGHIRHVGADGQPNTARIRAKSPKGRVRIRLDAERKRNAGLWMTAVIPINQRLAEGSHYCR